MMRITRASSKRSLAELGVDPDENSQKRGSFLNLTNFRPEPTKAQNPPKKDARTTKTVASNSTVSSQVYTQTFSQPTSQCSSQMTQSMSVEIFKQMQSIKRALDLNFKDVSARLSLQSIPSQFYDLRRYQEDHKKNSQRFISAENSYVAKNFFLEDRVVEFINFVRNFCGQKKFPRSEVLLNILEMILIIADEGSQNSCMSAQQSIIELHSLFTNILATFPPNPFRGEYTKLLLTPLKLKWLKNGSSQLSIFDSLLEFLSDLIHDTTRMGKKKAAIESEKKMNNFFFWDAQNEEKISFKNFKREEKFERVLLVFDLLIQVMEQDLAMFIIKYSRKLQSCLSDRKRNPLICSVLWNSHESVIVINSTIKSIISIFVTMVGLNYPRNATKTMSRLLNLVAQVVNLHEYEDEILEKYPTYSQRTKDLVCEIQKTVEKSVYYSMDLITNVAVQMKSPLIQMIFVDHMLQKINKEKQTISLQVPYMLILNKAFAKFEDISLPQGTKKEKFPPHNHLAPVQNFIVTKKGFLKLLEVYIDAVNVFFCIQTSLRELKKPDELKTEEKVSKATNYHNFDKELEMMNVDLDEPVKLRQIDLNFKKLVQIKLSKETCSFYQTEIKYFQLLLKLLKTCHQKYGKPFDDLNELVKTMKA